MPVSMVLLRESLRPPLTRPLTFIVEVQNRSLGVTVAS